MSFILDALKKSESDRQRQSGPALFEVKVAPPKSRFPIWAVAIVALLAINLGIVGWMLLRPSASQSQPAASQTLTPAQPAPAPIQTTPAPVQAAPAAVAQAAAPVTAPAPLNAPTPPAAPAAASAPSPTLAPEPTPPPAPATVAAEPQANPDDYAPATDPGAPLFKGHVKRGTEEGLPLYQDAAVVPGANLPDLRLDLHVYAARPQDRFALINMHKMHEGDALSDGTRVESITPDGVVLSRNGSKFLLPRD